MNSCAAGLTESLRTIVIYSHLVPALLTLFLASYALFKTRGSKLALLFFAFGISVSLWLINDLIAWGVPPDYYLVYYFWSWNDLIIELFFISGAYFFGTLARGNISSREKILLLLLCAPTFLLTLSGHSLIEFDQSVCEAINNPLIPRFTLFVELISVLYITWSLFIAWRSSNRAKRIQSITVMLALLLFFGVFAGTEYISSTTGIYEINLYGLFVLPLFLLVMTYVITNLELFEFRFLGTQILAYVLIITIGSQFLFLQNSTDKALTLLTLSIAIVMGMLLIQNAKREAEQRRLIEKQEQELEVINKQQENLMRFISHEVKGYLAKSAAAYAGILQGDYGAAPAPLKKMADSGLIDMRKGVDMVTDILDASNLQRGTVRYDKNPLDFRAAVEAVVHDSKPAAETKGVSLTFSVSNGDYTIVGDEAKLRRHVIRNLIDNSIHYTPTGNINVSLSRSADAIHFSVKDTGIGITKEDMRNLFTEGGKGKESVKVNTDSTGYGLFIAKQVTEAHGGKIWADSKGKGKGSEFVVELPLG